MYKAVHAQTGEEIIILHPRWKHRIDKLRALDAADLLLCQGCEQPIRVKAGAVKRAHFAHKHLKACSLGSESPEILNARAVLYAWLIAQYGPDDVTLEKQVQGLDLPRPLDCWVTTKTGGFAYWIIEAGIRLDAREALLAAFAKLSVPVRPIFLAAMLREDKKEFHSLHLSPTERAFLYHSSYDALITGLDGEGRSIHYLDPEQETLTTFRGLTLFHAPNWYHGVKKSGALADVWADRSGGTPVHPGETGRLDARRKKQNRLAEKRQKYQERQVDWDQRPPSAQPPAPRWGQGSRPVQPPPAWGAEALPCVTCGQITTEYWATLIGEDGRRMCRCRECLERETGSGAKGAGQAGEGELQ